MTRDELIAKIEKATDSDKDFQEIVSAFMQILSLDDAAVAEVFTVSRPTVARWKAGTNSPHPFVRPGMYEQMLEKLQATK